MLDAERERGQRTDRLLIIKPVLSSPRQPATTVFHRTAHTAAMHFP